MKLISGNSNMLLAQSVCDYLDIPLLKSEVSTFSDGEIGVNIQENVRGEDVFVLQSTSHPVNHNLMETIIMVDALKRSSARRITPVMPYFGYARQDARSANRSPISAKVIADMICTAGSDRILTVDLHSRQLQGFFNIPCDNLFALPVFVKDIQKRFKDENLMVVSPDVGGVIRARALAKKIDTPLSIVDKRREKANESEVMNIIGDIKGYNCIIIDDIVDTAGTLCNSAKALINNGAKSVHCYATHGVLSGPALERINSTAELTSLTITDSILQEHNSDKFRTVSISKLLSQAIRRVHEEHSVSELLE